MRTSDLPILLVESDAAQAAEIRDSLAARGRTVQVADARDPIGHDIVPWPTFNLVLDVDGSDRPHADMAAILSAYTPAQVPRVVVLMEGTSLLERLDLLRDARIRVLIKPVEADELFEALRPV